MILRAIRDLLILSVLVWGCLGLETADHSYQDYERATRILRGEHDLFGGVPYDGNPPHLRVLFWTTSTTVDVAGPGLMLAGSPLARFAAAMALWAGIVWLFGWARAHRRAQAAASIDGVQVLYLRPFTTDQPVKYKTKKMGFTVADPESMATFDEKLCDAFRELGRVTALVPETAGKPIGPDHIASVPDDQWQTFIERWLQQARLVVLVIGGSNSMDWELDTALRVVSRVRLVLVAPPQGIESVWAHVAPRLMSGGVEYELPSATRIIVHTQAGPRFFSGEYAQIEAVAEVKKALHGANELAKS